MPLFYLFLKSKLSYNRYIHDAYIGSTNINVYFWISNIVARANRIHAISLEWLASFYDCLDHVIDLNHQRFLDLKVSGVLYSNITKTCERHFSIFLFVEDEFWYWYLVLYERNMCGICAIKLEDKTQHTEISVCYEKRTCIQFR